MALFRNKRPAEVEAVRLVLDHGVREIAGYTLGEEPEWYRVARSTGAGCRGSITYDGGLLAVETLDGVSFAAPGDWIVREDGDLRVMTSQAFAATYEPADSTPV